jgi:hypothetical protein
VLYAIVAARMGDDMATLSLHGPLVDAIGARGYDLLGVAAFVMLAVMLIRTNRQKL